MPSITLDLTAHGAVIDIEVLPSLHYLKVLTESGRQVNALAARALIDTGASCTCLSSTLIEKLQIEPKSTTLIHTSSTGNNPVERNVYDLLVRVMLKDDNVKSFHTLAVVEGDPATPGVDALLGRDILNAGVLIFNGQSEHFSLCF